MPPPPQSALVLAAAIAELPGSVADATLGGGGLADLGDASASSAGDAAAVMLDSAWPGWSRSCAPP